MAIGSKLSSSAPLTGLVVRPAGYRALCAFTISVTGEKNLLIARDVSPW